MIKTAQNVIEGIPFNPKELYKSATNSDEVTVNSWRPTWIKYVEQNAKYDYNENSCWNLFGKEEYRPIILAGSGPSLKYNSHFLKEHPVRNLDGNGWTQGGGRGNVRIVSALHNFGYFEDNGIMTKDDYYITLDSGDITIGEVSEGGKRTPEEYWELTKDRTLIAVAQCHPTVLEKWQGPKYFFMVPTSDDLMNEYKKHMDFSKVPGFSVGGNVLGAGLYFAKAILGAGPIIFIGADFSFGYDHKFHGWNSHYDEKFQGVVPKVDIFGNKVYTWPSYFGFKCWFDYIAVGGHGGVSQLFINSTEGGILGAYPEGNIKQILQMPLKGALEIFNRHKLMPKIMDNNTKYVIF
jgi:hypothetical protein